MDGLCIWMGCVVLVESISPNKPIYACRCLIFFLNNRSHHKLDVCTQTNTPTLQIAISFEKTEIAWYEDDLIWPTLVIWLGDCCQQDITFSLLFLTRAFVRALVAALSIWHPVLNWIGKHTVKNLCHPAVCCSNPTSVGIEDQALQWPTLQWEVTASLGRLTLKLKSVNVTRALREIKENAGLHFAITFWLTDSVSFLSLRTKRVRLKAKGWNWMPFSYSESWRYFN